MFIALTFGQIALIWAAVAVTVAVFASLHFRGTKEAPIPPDEIILDKYEEETYHFSRN